MSNLVAYFQSEELAHRALDRYLGFANDRDWRIIGDGGKLQLYDWASQAFDPATPADDALDAFRRMYSAVAGWPGVQRGGSLAPAEEVFTVLRSPAHRFLYDGSITLARLKHPTPEATALEEFLPLVQFLKPTQRYPWMAVTKVMHFVNPGLFPIWDTDVLWNKVMWPGPAEGNASFRRAYQSFCKEHEFHVLENGAVFVHNYVLWAAHHIQQADDSFMAWFEEWMQQRFPNDIPKYSSARRLRSLYATAFEFVAIGAAYLELRI